MTIITVTTVGYREVHELSRPGIVLTIVLLVGGVGTFFYVINAGGRTLIEGELQEMFGRRRLEKKIRELHNHYIICGFGRMGKIISAELAAAGMKFIVIEKNPEALHEKDEHLLALPGDATRDSVLREAGIERARGLISVLPTTQRTSMSSSAPGA